MCDELKNLVNPCSESSEENNNNSGSNNSGNSGSSTKPLPFEPTWGFGGLSLDEEDENSKE